MNYAIERLKEVLEEIECFTLDGIDLINILQDIIEEIADDKNICLKCRCYKKIQEWNEYHPYQEGYAAEKWAAFYCPSCGMED